MLGGNACVCVSVQAALITGPRATLSTHPPTPTHPPLQLEGEKAAAADKRGRVADELAEAQARLRQVERELKHLAAQQKALAAKRQVRPACLAAWHPSARLRRAAVQLRAAALCCLVLR